MAEESSTNRGVAEMQAEACMAEMKQTEAWLRWSRGMHG